MQSSKMAKLIQATTEMWFVRSLLFMWKVTNHMHP